MLRAPISLAGSTRRGMVTAQVALSLSALMAMLAVVADGGLLLVERRHAQATADAAALAAASDLYGNGSNLAGPAPRQCHGRRLGQRLHQRRHDFDSHGQHSRPAPANPVRLRHWLCRGDRDVEPATLF